MQVYQQVGGDIAPPLCNIKNETSAQVFPCKFCRYFSVFNFIKNKTSTQVFSY